MLQKKLAEDLLEIMEKRKLKEIFYGAAVGGALGGGVLRVPKPGLLHMRGDGEGLTRCRKGRSLTIPLYYLQCRTVSESAAA